MSHKTMVWYWGEYVALLDLCAEVGVSAKMVHDRHARIGRPEDITCHDDILAAKGKRRAPSHVVVDGERLTVIQAADKYLCTKPTVMDRIRRFGLVLSSAQLRPRYRRGPSVANEVRP